MENITNMPENYDANENCKTHSILSEIELNHTPFIEHLAQDLLDYGSGNEYIVKITRLYVCGLVLSIIFLVVDVGTDSYLAYQYFQYDEKYYFWLTVLFILFPAFVNTMLSLRMYASNKESVSFQKWVLRSFALALQFAPLIRYIETLQFALKLRKETDKSSAEYDKYSRLLLREDSNLALLRIIEGFLEAAPQQVLQIAILLRLKNSENFHWLQIYQYMTISTSLVSIAWTFAVYNRSIRFARDDKRKLNWAGSIVQVSWFFLVTSSRILAISELASVFPLSTFIACAAHWLLMTVWISIFDRTWFCRRSEADSRSKLKNSMELSFCAVLGLVYIFAFLPTTDGDTRYKYVFYYCIYFVENTLAILFWSVWNDEQVKQSWWFVPLLVVTFCMFLFGVILMLIYYWVFHPKRGLIRKLRETQEAGMQNEHESNGDSHHSNKMIQTEE